jgi:hypothetical protein
LRNAVPPLASKDLLGAFPSERVLVQ